MARQIGILPEVAGYLEELIQTLHKLHYFGFKESSKEYVGNIVNYFFKYIGILPDKKASSYFNRYGKNMRYLSYRANKQTTWYIFFPKT